MTLEEKQALQAKVTAAKEAKATAAAAAAAKETAEEKALLAEAKELGIEVPAPKKLVIEKKEEESKLGKENESLLTKEDLTNMGVAIATAIKASSVEEEEEEIVPIYS